MRKGQPAKRLFNHPTVAVEDMARAYLELVLDPAVQIEPREYQQAALNAWRTNDRRGSVVLATPTAMARASHTPSQRLSVL
jgi:superfamily II DNA or RNA helicase